MNRKKTQNPNTSKQNSFLKNAMPHLVAVLIITLFSVIYFSPQLSGKKVSAGDAISSTAYSKQVLDYEEKTGEVSNWNPSMFSGMPWGLLYLGQTKNLLYNFRNTLDLYIAPPMGMFIKGSLICYLVLVLLGINSWIGLLMSLALMYNSNYIILIEAGHWNKLLVITYFPLILGSLLLIKQAKFLYAFVCMSFGISMAIFFGHIQMVYYLMLLLFIFSLFLVTVLIKEKEYTRLGTGIGVLILAVILGALSNFSQLYSSKQYSDHTMRGKSILVENSPNATSDSKDEGLKWDYAMRWSNDSRDLFSLIIPRAVGSSSSEDIPIDSKLGRLIQQNGGKRQSGNEVKAPLYWGALDFTSGSYYIGVSLFLLFVFSLFVIPSYLRWGFLASIFFCFLLSMGKNMEWLNRFFFDYLPLFSKFRTPNSIMNVVPMFFIFPIAFGLQRVLDESEERMKYLKTFIISTGITAGILVFYYLFESSSDSFISGQEVNRYADQVKEIFIETRKSLLFQDVLRSLFIVALGFGAVFMYLKKAYSDTIIIGILFLMVIVDLVQISKRYLDQDNYVTTRNYDSFFSLTPSDNQILNLEKKGRGYYRVYNRTQNTFNDATQSYHHNTIGGYHAAKLLRYQDMIDRHLSKGNMAVFNMLNTKYFVGDKGEVQVNPRALGNAWFVSDIKEVSTPNQEIDALSEIDPAQTAVILAPEFADKLPQVGNGEGTIEMVTSEVNEWTYEYETNQPQLVVFSEIWYPQEEGFVVKIDDEVVNNLIRANYILRALPVPAGKHTINIKFDPSPKYPWISIICSLMILVAILVAIFLSSSLRKYLPLKK